MTRPQDDLDREIAEAVPDLPACDECENCGECGEHYHPVPHILDIRQAVRALVERREREAHEDWLTETHAAAYSEGYTDGAAKALKELAEWMDAYADQSSAVLVIQREALRRAKGEGK